MKKSLTKFLVLYIGLALCASPLFAEAANKKTRHHVSSSKIKHKSLKSKAVRYKISGQKIRHKIRTHKIQDPLANYDGSTPLTLASSKALVINQLTGEVVYAKNTNLSTPIASVTKLMTAMVVLDAHLSMDELLFISDEDVDYLKGTSSKLRVGNMLTRGELLQLALIASENRAAAALGRNYPDGITAFVNAMNDKAQSLGMKSTHFVDSSGLDSNNVSTAEDLAKMVHAAYHYPEIRQISTTASQEINLYGRDYPLHVVNTNTLVRGGEWTIGLSKTGFINEAGRCLVMQTEISGQPMIIVLLDSAGKMSRIGDANRIRKWIEYNESTTLGEHVSG